MEINDKTYPTVKNLDGSYFDVPRDGKIVTRCFTDLTMAEQDLVLDTVGIEELKTMCKSFGNALRGLCDMCHIEGTGDEEGEFDGSS